jgi:hypothetical protein
MAGDTVPLASHAAESDVSKQLDDQERNGVEGGEMPIEIEFLPTFHHYFGGLSPFRAIPGNYAGLESGDTL